MLKSKVLRVRVRCSGLGLAAHHVLSAHAAALAAAVGRRLAHSRASTSPAPGECDATVLMGVDVAGFKGLLMRAAANLPSKGSA